ncbi:MAG: hypothetical protein HYY17_12955 [Planctomycetes bacterium]|nr:hypothetical protein [Planctomycetota bacterium]
MADASTGTDDECLNPIGIELWLGQALLIVGIVIGIYLAASVGFRETNRYAKREDLFQARRSLGFVRQEFEANLATLRAFRDRTKDKKGGASLPLPVRTSYLEAASAQPYMVLVDRALLMEMTRLMTGYPFALLWTDTEKLPKKFVVGEEHAFEICAEALEHAEKTILPKLAAEEKALDEAIANLEKAR